uniref:Uncharacterized protein n=1 Tax=Streptomyces sp. 44030 TaxID=364102 RepID=Q2LEY0_9ACTN|nr:hypothetical protein [Streptomyces sp. 44030]ABC67335.1 hypothetical protein pRL1.6c [Streptomyces sp. 44030]
MSTTGGGGAGQAYLFEAEDVVLDVATLDTIFEKSGQRILAMGVHVWLLRLVGNGRVSFDMRVLAKEVHEGRPALTECVSVLADLGLVVRVKYLGHKGQWLTDTVVFKTPCTEQQLAQLAHNPAYRDLRSTIVVGSTTYLCAELREAYLTVPPYGMRNPFPQVAPTTRNLVVGASSENTTFSQVTPTTRNLVVGPTCENTPSAQVAPTTRNLVVGPTSENTFPQVAPTTRNLVAHKEVVSFEVLSSKELPSIDRDERASDDAPLEPSADAQDLVASLEYGLHSRPSATDLKLLARLVDAATAGPGLTMLELKRHLQAALNRVKAPNEGGAPVPYLRGALAPERLPAPRARISRPAAPAPAVVNADQKPSGKKSPAEVEQARAELRNIKAMKGRSKIARKTPGASSGGP